MEYNSTMEVRLNMGIRNMEPSSPKGLKDLETLDQFKSSIITRVSLKCLCKLCKDYVQGVGFVTVVGKSPEMLQQFYPHLHPHIFLPSLHVVM